MGVKLYDSPNGIRLVNYSLEESNIKDPILLIDLIKDCISDDMILGIHRKYMTDGKEFEHSIYMRDSYLVVSDYEIYYGFQNNGIWVELNSIDKSEVDYLLDGMKSRWKLI